MISLYAAMTVFIPYRQSRGLDTAPPWPMIGVGIVGLATSGLWLSSDGGPESLLEWVAFAGLVALLVFGVRRMRARGWDGGGTS